MPADLPDRSSSGSLRGVVHNQFRETARSHQPGQSPGVRTSHTIHGVFHEADVPVAYAGEAAAAGGMNYRGAYTPTPVTPYRIFDVVVGLPGPNEGTYIAVIDDPPEQPWTGIGWVQLAAGSNVGKWV